VSTHRFYNWSSRPNQVWVNNSWLRLKLCGGQMAEHTVDINFSGIKGLRNLDELIKVLPELRANIIGSAEQELEAEKQEKIREENQKLEEGKWKLLCSNDEIAFIGPIEYLEKKINELSDPSSDNEFYLKGRIVIVSKEIHSISKDGISFEGESYKTIKCDPADYKLGQRVWFKGRIGKLRCNCTDDLVIIPTAEAEREMFLKEPPRDIYSPFEPQNKGDEE
jgi:hypothetical protein